MDHPLVVVRQLRVSGLISADEAAVLLRLWAASILVSVQLPPKEPK